MTADDKTSFFADMSLNGSLSYLFEHNQLNQFLQKNTVQNQGLLIYGAIAFIAFIISFSIASIAVSPIIPLLVMASTTLMILFNSYRVQFAIDSALDPNPSWLKQILASDASIGLLISSSMLFMCSLLISTVATGGLALPAMTFSAGAATAISSIFLFTSEILLGLFSALATTYLVADETMIISQPSKDCSLGGAQRNPGSVAPNSRSQATGLHIQATVPSLTEEKDHHTATCAMW
jgi:Cu+-exporting ATPase